MQFSSAISQTQQKQPKKSTRAATLYKPGYAINKPNAQLQIFKIQENTQLQFWMQCQHQ